MSNPSETVRTASPARFCSAPSRTSAERELHLEDLGLEALVADVLEPADFLLGHDWARDLDQMRLLRRLLEDVAVVADVGRQAHHQLFADRVDRRVGDLREELLEVGEEGLGLVREHRERGVVAHGADRLGALLGHRLQDDGEVLGGVAEALLPREQVVGHVGGDDLVEEPAHAHLVLRHPAAVGLAARHLRLHLGVPQDAAVLQVEVDDLAGLQAALLLHLVVADVEHAGLGGHHEEAVLAEGVARGAQAVAVENRARVHAVAEGHGGRAVPRLHQHRLVFEEPAHVAAQVVLGAPGLRHQHHHRVGKAAARGHQQLEHVVEAGGVALPGGNQRKQLLQVVADDVAPQVRLARLQAVQVAAQRVDLAVVREVAEGVRELPRGEGVGGVALVDERERAFEVRVVQVLVEALDLAGEEESLVDDAPAAAAAEVEPFAGLLGQAADHVELDVERGVAVQRRAVEEGLADVRQRRARGTADGGGVHGHFAEADRLHALGLRDAGDLRVEGVGGERVVHEVHRHAVAGGELGHDLAEEAVGHRQKQARAVARLGIAAGGAAVHEPLEDRDPLEDDLVGGDVVDVGDQADAAGVVFVCRIVEGLRLHKKVLRALPLSRVRGFVARLYRKNRANYKRGTGKGENGPKNGPERPSSARCASETGRKTVTGIWRKQREIAIIYRKRKTQEAFGPVPRPEVACLRDFSWLALQIL